MTEFVADREGERLDVPLLAADRDFVADHGEAHARRRLGRARVRRGPREHAAHELVTVRRLALVVLELRHDHAQRAGGDQQAGAAAASSSGMRELDEEDEDLSPLPDNFGNDFDDKTVPETPRRTIRLAK